jgi:hypothetical protein
MPTTQRGQRYWDIFGSVSQVALALRQIRWELVDFVRPGVLSFFPFLLFALFEYLSIYQEIHTH